MERSSGAAPPRRLRGGGAEQGNQLLEIEVEQVPGVVVIGLAGELDLGTLPRLEGPLFEHLNADSAVVVDLRRLSFIDSSGIGLLVKAHHAADGSNAFHTVVAERSQVARVFALAGIGEALPLFVDRDEAIAALKI